jgi:NAD(P)-dependent dehydrogenase (short-subunit alcohol dehydrogenase family)
MGVVVITGCSSGFGLHATVAFARRGDRVYATMRNLGKDGALRKALADEGLEAEVVQLDVTDDASVRAGIGGVLEREGHVDVLVNNAGVGGTELPIELLSDDDWMNVVGTNLLGVVRTTRAVFPSMREQRSGAIVNVSSIAGRLPGTPMTAPYAASKHAVCAFSDSVLAEGEDFGIRVACIEPGFFATSVVDNATVPDLTGSPYENVSKAMANFYRTGVDNGAPPEVVADAIVRATEEDSGDSIHLPIGADAELYMQMLEGMSPREFRAAGRQILGY